MRAVAIIFATAGTASGTSPSASPTRNPTGAPVSSPTAHTHNDWISTFSAGEINRNPASEICQATDYPTFADDTSGNCWQIAHEHDTVGDCQHACDADDKCTFFEWHSTDKKCSLERCIPGGDECNEGSKCCQFWGNSAPEWRVYVKPSTAKRKGVALALEARKHFPKYTQRRAQPLIGTGSCDGHCGERPPGGGCWCDAICAWYHDCCTTEGAFCRDCVYAGGVGATFGSAEWVYNNFWHNYWAGQTPPDDASIAAKHTLWCREHGNYVPPAPTAPPTDNPLTLDKTISGDPFVIDAQGRRIQFFLPIAEEILLIDCNGMELSGVVFGTDIPGDHQQWFNKFRVRISGKDVLLVSIKKNATSIADESDIQAPREFIQPDITNVHVEVEGVVMRKAGTLALSANEGALLAVWVTDAITTAQFSYGDGLVFQISTAVAQKFVNNNQQKLYTHLDIRFVEMMQSQCKRGVLAEIWGVAPMSQSTAKYLQPPGEADETRWRKGADIPSPAPSDPTMQVEKEPVNQTAPPPMPTQTAPNKQAMQHADSTKQLIEPAVGKTLYGLDNAGQPTSKQTPPLIPPTTLPKPALDKPGEHMAAKPSPKSASETDTQPAPSIQKPSLDKPDKSIETDKPGQQKTTLGKPDMTTNPPTKLDRIHDLQQRLAVLEQQLANKAATERRATTLEKPALDKPSLEVVPPLPKEPIPKPSLDNHAHDNDTYLG